MDYESNAVYYTNPRDPGAGVSSRAAPLGVASGAVGYGAGGPVWLDIQRSKRAPNPYELVNAYKNVAFSCIQLNANGVSRVPLRLYARTGRKQARPRRACRALPAGREKYLRSLPNLARSLGPDDQVDEVMEHPFLDALEAPNDFFDGNLLLQHVARCLDAVGTAYLFPERPMRPDGAGDPTQARAGMKLWSLQAQYVYPVKGSGTQVLREYRYFGDTFAPTDLVRFRNLSLRDPYLSSYAPLHACFESVGLGDYYLSVVESFLKNDARMSLVIGPKDPNRPFGEAERRRLEHDANQRFGQGRQGRIWVTDGAFDVAPVAYPPADLSGLEISKWERLLVANCFDVPISLLQSEDSNKAVASEGTHQHQYYAIAPRCVLIAAALTRQLARPVDDRLFFAFDDPVKRDEERHTKIVDMQVKSGTRTINEARAEDGMPPVPWGDEPWYSNLLVQPSEIARRIEQQQQQQQQGQEQAQQDPGNAGEPQLPDAGELPPSDPSANPEAVDETSKPNRMWDRFARALDRLEEELAA